ncbi:MAG: 50S ribosomal protein L30 [Acidimicrobiaceae bacterium]|nr:50S ribosomal protein L30 [Acidimicrobiaceae bacterium]
MDYEISNDLTKLLAYGVSQQRSSFQEECSQRIKNQSAQFANWRRSKMALKVTQIRSSIGSKPKQRGTLRALGLGRIGKSHTLPDKPEIRGMINTVPHLIEVEEVS